MTAAGVAPSASGPSAPAAPAPAAARGAGPLAGVKVLDISTVMAGPFATHLLADQGADVIKVEPPEGDIMRFSGPSPRPGMSPIFQHMNRNKRSIVLDLKQAGATDVLLTLARTADVFVYNMRPRAMARLGLSYDTLRAANPAIVYCGIVGFGQEGPYAARPAYDDLIQGASGIPDLVGRATGGEPRYVPFAMCDRIAGLYAANALLAALLERTRIGKGTAIEIPMFETNVHFLLVEHLFGASFEPAAGDGALNTRMLEPNRKPYRTSDGYVCVLPYTTRHWRSLFELVGRAELQDDPRFADFASRREHIHVLYELLDGALRQRPTAAWLADFERIDIPAATANAIADLPSDPHLVASSFFRSVAQEDGRFLHMAAPVQWKDRAFADPSPAPVLAEDTRAILREAGYADERIDALARDGVTRLQPRA